MRAARRTPGSVSVAPARPTGQGRCGIVALAIGLLIGLERGWRRRRADEGARVAGMRTFGLIGLGAALLVRAG